MNMPPLPSDDSTLFKALIGAAGGVILLLIVLSIVLCYFLSKRNSKKAPNSQEGKPPFLFFSIEDRTD